MDTALSPSTLTIPSPAKLTLPEPVVFVIDVISVTSPLTSTAYVLAIPSVPSRTVVFLPSITFTAFLASSWIIVLPASVILDKSFFATPLIVSIRSAIALPFQSPYVNKTLPSVTVTTYSLFSI